MLTPGLTVTSTGSEGSTTARIRGIGTVATIPVSSRPSALRTNVGVKYTSEYNTSSDLNPAKIQGGYALVNARIGIGAPDDRWVVELWGRNLTDKDYYQVVFDAPFQHFGAPFPDSNGLDAYLGDPRTYDATFRIKM